MSTDKSIFYAGLFLGGGIVLSTLLYIGYSQYLIYRTTKYIENVGNQLETEMAASAAEAERKRVAIATQRRQEQQRTAALALERERAEQRATLANQRKEEAWHAYYQDPEDCLVFRSDAHMVKCTNARMSKRREFEALYHHQAGQKL